MHAEEARKIANLKIIEMLKNKPKIIAVEKQISSAIMIPVFEVETKYDLEVKVYFELKNYKVKETKNGLKISWEE